MCLICEKLPSCLPKWLFHFVIPPAMTWVLLSHTLAGICYYQCFGLGLSNRVFPDGSVGKEFTCNAGEWIDSWVGRICWRRDRLPTPVFLGFPCGSAGKKSACNTGDLGLIPGLGRSPGEGKGYPLQYSGLENSMDWIIHGVAKSQTQPSNFTSPLKGIQILILISPP